MSQPGDPGEGIRMISQGFGIDLFNIDVLIRSYVRIRIHNLFEHSRDAVAIDLHHDFFVIEKDTVHVMPGRCIERLLFFCRFSSELRAEIQESCSNQEQGQDDYSDCAKELFDYFSHKLDDLLGTKMRK